MSRARWPGCADRASLVACLDHVARTGQHARAMVLAAGLAAVGRRDGPWADVVTWHATVIDAAQRLHERLDEASALIDLGTVQYLMGDYPSSVRVVTRALAIYRDLGDRRGEANALRELGRVRRVQGEFIAANELLEQALGFFRDLGDRFGEADTLADLGIARQQTSEYPGAAEAESAPVAVITGIAAAAEI